ncbi:glycosyltransferase family 2 protein [Paraburkholderia oxyphila]|uniref:glycosyltransferase family 2 protein n=1 Tax=Paraburkholderia oxyphila TaxID=614212 RepID=UPI0005BD3712|nr:glycosyltransferase [Paraburkholderia oxyphila]
MAGSVARRVRQGGGLLAVLHRLMEIRRNEGIEGIRSRLADRFGGGTEAARRNNYGEWIRLYDTLDDAKRAALRARFARMRDAPLISVLMPTYNPNLQWLREAIESVRDQIYPNWELCIADDASTDPQVRPVLEAYARDDRRIKVTLRERNGHISAASNSALALAGGEWVALLDQDDRLAEHALVWVADAIERDPTLQLIYSDEDKIDDQGQRHDPYFKCDWNRDLFYSQNMFCHLGIYRRSLLNSIGGFREGVEGAQDHDLVLRCIEQTGDAPIAHIPRVLYHWRVHAGSTAAGADAKSYAAAAGERALQAHFVRTNVAAAAEWVGYGYRVRYALPSPAPLVSLIIPTRNALELMRMCVESIRTRTTYPNYEIIIVDNGSDDAEALEYFASLAAGDGVSVLRDDRPFNYSALNNRAVEQARGSLVALINNDIEVRSPDWLSEMVSIAMQPGVGAVGAKLLYPDNTLQHAGIVLGIGGVAGHANKHGRPPHRGYFGRTGLIGSWSAITAACMVVRREVFQGVGGLNETDLTVAFNDVDFCLKLKAAGYRNVLTPYAELYHHESATRGYEDNPEKRARFRAESDYMRRQWSSWLKSDPAYSPNLTLQHEDFSLAWPPRVAPLESLARNAPVGGVEPHGG